MTANRLLAHFIWLMVMCASLLGCNQNTASDTEQDGIPKENIMTTSHEARAASAIPPIDAAAPKTFQTASFGLG